MIHSDEAPLFIGFLALEGSGQDGCLNRAACRAPDTAKDYLKAAKAVVKGMEMFDNQKFNSSMYAYTFDQFEKSIHDGIEGAPCNVIYHCSVWGERCIKSKWIYIRNLRSINIKHDILLFILASSVKHQM